MIGYEVASPSYTSSETMKDEHVRSRFEENKKDDITNAVFGVLFMFGLQRHHDPKSR